MEKKYYIVKWNVKEGKIPKIVDSYFFTNERGFDEDEKLDISRLPEGGSLTIGNNDVQVTRIAELK